MLSTNTNANSHLGKLTSRSAALSNASHKNAPPADTLGSAGTTAPALKAAAPFGFLEHKQASNASREPANPPAGHQARIVASKSSGGAAASEPTSMLPSNLSQNPGGQFGKCGPDPPQPLEKPQPADLDSGPEANAALPGKALFAYIYIVEENGELHETRNFVILPSSECTFAQVREAIAALADDLEKEGLPADF